MRNGIEKKNRWMDLGEVNLVSKQAGKRGGKVNFFDFTLLVWVSFANLLFVFFFALSIFVNFHYTKPGKQNAEKDLR